MERFFILLLFLGHGNKSIAKEGLAKQQRLLWTNEGSTRQWKATDGLEKMSAIPYYLSNLYAKYARNLVARSPNN